jgi:hypothetical protein
MNHSYCNGHATETESPEIARNMLNSGVFAGTGNGWSEIATFRGHAHSWLTTKGRGLPQPPAAGFVPSIL